MTPTELRLKLRAAGFECIPVEGKVPPMEKWQEKGAATTEEIQLWPKTWHFAHNTGILAKFAPGLDLDIKDEEAADAMAHLAHERFEEHGVVTERFGQWPKRLIPLRTDEPFAKLTRAFRAPDGTEHKIEILADGQQWVAFGQHPIAKTPYRWTHGEPGKDFAREQLPYVRQADAEQYLDAAEMLLIEQHGFTLITGLSQTNGGEPHAPGGAPLAPSSRVAAAVRVIPNNDLQWDDWNRVAMAIWRASNGNGEGFEIFDAWSQRSHKYDPRATSKKWSALTKCPPDRIGFGTLKYLADQADPTWEDALRGEPPEPHPDDPGPQPSDRTAQSVPAPGGLNVWNAGDDIEPPPPRGWLLGNTFCRRFLSSLFGDGGVGKTAVRYAQALALASGHELTGEHVFQRARVLIVSLEDDADELRRRMLAARLHFDIPASEVNGWLFLAAPGAAGGKLMTTDKYGRTVHGQLSANLETEIVAHSIDVVLVDPFVKSHGVEENLNSAIDDVAQILSDLAAKHDLAVDVPHHISKGIAEPGNANRGRGASSLVNACRLVSTITPMSPEEADAFGIPEDDRRLYVRVDRAKVNIARAACAAKWFRLVGVPLNNGTSAYPAGDEVQTAEPWKPPETWADLDPLLLNRILSAIDAGLGDGNFYTGGNRTTERSAWQVVQRHAPAKSEVQCREVIRTWIKNEVLVPFDYDSPTTRKSVKGLRVDPSKRPT